MFFVCRLAALDNSSPKRVLALRAAREKTAVNEDPDGAERGSVSGLSEPSEVGDYKKPESRARRLICPH